MDPATTEYGRLYIAVRSDLSVGLQMAQAIHAGFSYAQAHPQECHDWFRDSQVLVVVAVPDEEALHHLAAQAKSRGISHAIWREPDLGHEATAVVLSPTHASRRLCANLPLAGRELVTT